jgi:outer membrane receptor protein involved in Fe transport
MASRRSDRARAFVFFFLVVGAGLSTNAGETLDFTRLSLEELLNMSIETATKTDEKLRDVPASVVIVTRADIERYGYQTLEEILTNVPGLYLIDDHSWNGGVLGVRGFWTNRPRNIIFMVNGVSQSDGYLTAHFLEHFNMPVEAIDRIEIVRGPMSVIYGSGAFFGAINIITNESWQGEGQNIIAASAGSLGTTRLAIRINGDEGDLSYAVSAGSYNTDGADEPYARMVSDPSSLINYGLTEDEMTTKGRLEYSTRYFSISAAMKSFYANMSYSNSTRGNFMFFPPKRGGMPKESDFAVVELGYRKVVSEKLDLDASFTYHKLNSCREFFALTDDAYGTENTRAEYYEAELSSKITVSPQLAINNGLYYNDITMADNRVAFPALGLDFSWFLDESDTITTVAAYSQLNYTPRDNLRFVLGVRAEHMQPYSAGRWDYRGTPAATLAEGRYDRDTIDVIPRAAMVYSINDRNVLKILYGEAINRPAMVQNAEQMSSPINPPQLVPEEITTFEVNYVGSLALNLDVNASYFHNELENLIVRTARLGDGGQYVPFNTNGGTMSTDGIELTLRSQLTPAFSFEASGTWQDTKNRRENLRDVEPEYSPSLLGYLKASYNLSDKASCSLTGVYVAEMEPYWEVSPDDPDTGRRIGDRVDGYITLGANIRVEDIFDRGYYVGLRGSNILDEEYLYPVTMNNIPSLDKGFVGSPRTFIASFGRKF